MSQQSSAMGSIQGRDLQKVLSVRHFFCLEQSYSYDFCLS